MTDERTTGSIERYAYARAICTVCDASAMHRSDGRTTEHVEMGPNGWQPVHSLHAPPPINMVDGRGLDSPEPARHGPLIAHEPAKPINGHPVELPGPTTVELQRDLAVAMQECARLRAEVERLREQMRNIAEYARKAVES